ncbi:hypothetical protein GCM10009613_54640 [Pseudonocardia kongjuensis]|uniref:DUF1156 domain-containing protein n=1 Tax=Pseudonocardia kongjuensis TaxID=102227 RepID=A0ABN1Y8G5_9PSEU
MRSWWLGKKKGKESWVIPSVTDGRVTYRIGHGSKDLPPSAEEDGTVGRTGARCVGCSASVDLKYVRSEGRNGRIGFDLIAIVAQGNRTRHYLEPNEEHRTAAALAPPQDSPDGPLPAEALGFRVQAYGFKRYADLFTARQLVALTTYSDLVSEVRDKVALDARVAGRQKGLSLEQGGAGAEAYADAVSIYLGFAVSRLASTNSSLCRWNSAPSKESVSDTFARQAISMVWDFAEGNVWTKGPCELTSSAGWVARVLDHLSSERSPGNARQENATKSPAAGQLISTDPPYYDNIGYSDLSDYFYIWLRRSLRNVYPSLLSTLLVPKSEELVANPFRHGGKDGAHRFFESGFNEVFQRARQTTLEDYPISVFYAFKQAETTNQGEASTGWETFLEGMMNSGWAITATWPMRSERGGRMRDVDSNALASSIVLTLRPRPEGAARTTRRGFLGALKAELPDAMRELQQGAIAPVDLPQAAIGPGMAIFSRHSVVLNDDGQPMRVRAALSMINEVLDEVLSEQEGDFDADTRFALAWFRQHGFDTGDFGDADNLARARNASLEHLERAGILSLRGTRGKVTMLPPSQIDPEWDPGTDNSISTWEVVMHLSRTLTDSGIVAASALLSRVPESIDRDLCKELAFLLFALAEDAKRAKVAIEFNALGTAWNDIVAGAGAVAQQESFDYTGG